MGHVNISEIQPDMVLASPVCNSQGVVLLQKGARVTNKHIRLLKTWGVSKVDIEGIENRATNISEFSNEKLNRLYQTLDERFAGLPDNEIMTEILRVAKKQIAAKLLCPAEEGN